LFDKWEEKELTAAEWEKADKKSTKFVMNLSSGKVLVKVRAPKPEKAQREKMSEAAPVTEVKLKAQVQVRFRRLKRATDEYGLPKVDKNGRQIIKAVTLGKTKIARKAKFIVRKTGFKQLPLAMHFVDLSMLDKNDELTFDEDYAEPINPETGEPEWSDELEAINAQGIHGQMVEVATRFWKFILTRQHLLFMAMGAAAGLFIVIGIADIFHFFGGVQINWTPHTPG
jgi:hypothetical protein